MEWRRPSASSPPVSTRHVPLGGAGPRALARRCFARLVEAREALRRGYPCSDPPAERAAEAVPASPAEQQQAR